MTLIFNDDTLMMKLNVIHKLRKYLRRHTGETFHISWLHRRIGSGLNKDEFTWCVKMLEVSAYVTLSEGRCGGINVTAKDKGNAPTYSPEEVIAHAMQCPPITEELLNEVK